MRERYRSDLRNRYQVRERQAGGTRTRFMRVPGTRHHARALRPQAQLRRLVHRAARAHGRAAPQTPAQEPAPGSCIALPKRWIGERTFGWLNRFRLLSKEYERTIESSRAGAYLAILTLMLRRLTTSESARRDSRKAA
jgi:hypothetical protein